ncbi:MAG TPA: SDR family oxidoreductase [Candidatus Tectomicrobia bacterium]
MQPLSLSCRQDHIHMAYKASKGAVRSMTKSAPVHAVQFAKAGLRVNSVHPGVMPPMHTSTRDAESEGSRRGRVVPGLG